jgi:hypothetical protein
MGAQLREETFAQVYLKPCRLLHAMEAADLAQYMQGPFEW